MSFQGGGTTTGRNSIPNAAGGAELKAGAKNVLNPATRDKGFASFMIDPAEYAKMGQGFADTAFGKNLDISGTPTGQHMLGAIERERQNSLGSDIANVRSQFAQSGQHLSGPLLAAEQQAGRASQQGSQDAIISALFNSYGQERGRQMNALSSYGQYQQTPLTIASQVAPLFGKQTSQTERANPVTTYLGK